MDAKLKDAYTVATYMGWKLQLENGHWAVRDWTNDTKSMTPATMWGTVEETYDRCLFDMLHPTWGWAGKYASSFDQLMQVVRKICESGSYRFVIEGNSCYVEQCIRREWVRKVDVVGTSLLASLYTAVIKCIEYINAEVCA